MKSTKYLWVAMCAVLVLLYSLERRDLKALKAQVTILQADLNTYRDAYHDLVGVGVWNGSKNTNIIRWYGSIQSQEQPEVVDVFNGSTATSRLGVMGIDGSNIYCWYGSNTIITKKEPIRIYGTLYTNSLIGTNFDWAAP